MTTPETQQTNGATALAAPNYIQQAQQHGGSIASFASAANFEAAQRMAKALAASTMVPKEYQGPVGLPNVLIAMDLASRIGASVFAVMQNMDVIHGRPSLRSTFLIATVNACGRFTPLRFRWQGEEGKDSWGCRAVAKDRDGGEECVGALITIGLAKAEGWTAKNGSKWKTIPEQMLMYRAASFWTRVYAPETSLGMHTSEEMQDVHGPVRIDLQTGVVQGSAKALEADLLGVSAPAEPASEPAVDAEPVAAEAKRKPGSNSTPRRPDETSDGEPPDSYPSTSPELGDAYEGPDK